VFVTTLSAPSIMGVAVEGGPVVDVTAQLRDADLVDGPINGSYLARRRPGGTEWETITRPDTAGNGEGAYMWPQLLPGGTHVLYTVLEPSLMWAGSRIVVEEISSGARTQVAQEGTYGRYAPTGHVVYIDVNGTLHAVAFDLERQAVLGSPFVVDSGVRTAYWGGSASFAVSESGTLAFVRGSSWENHRLTWVDRDGSIIEEVGRPVTVEGVRLSPDGRYAATYVASDNSDIYLFDLQTGDDRRLTFEPETEDNPVWSSDGRSIAYRRIVSGREHRVYTRDLTSGAAPQHVYTADVYVTPRSWSSDGRALALDQEGALLILDLESGRVDTVSTMAATEGGRFSPNGRWLAYVSRETGQHEVYVVSYPELAGKQQVSASGGRMPEWSSQSDELFFLDADTLMVVDVRTNDRFERSAPRPLFVSADLQRGLWFAVSADGERFLYAAANPDAPAREIHVVANWFEELKATEGN
jgi:serine/threonine-protein kinase